MSNPLFSPLGMLHQEITGALGAQHSLQALARDSRVSEFSFSGAL